MTFISVSLFGVCAQVAASLRGPIHHANGAASVSAAEYRWAPTLLWDFSHRNHSRRSRPGFQRLKSTPPLRNYSKHQFYVIKSDYLFIYFSKEDLYFRQVKPATTPLPGCIVVSHWLLSDQVWLTQHSLLFACKPVIFINVDALQCFPVLVIEVKAAVQQQQLHTRLLLHLLSFDGRKEGLPSCTLRYHLFHFLTTSLI